MGEGVILIRAVVEATDPVLVRKGGIGQRQHREQGAHENLGEPRLDGSSHDWLTRVQRRSQSISIPRRRDRSSSCRQAPSRLRRTLSPRRRPTTSPASFISNSGACAAPDARGRARCPRGSRQPGRSRRKLRHVVARHDGLPRVRRHPRRARRARHRCTKAVSFSGFTTGGQPIVRSIAPPRDRPAPCRTRRTADGPGAARAHVEVEGAQGAAHHALSGTMLFFVPASSWPTLRTTVSWRGDLLADEALHADEDVRGRGHRIDGEMRIGAVAALARDLTAKPSPDAMFGPGRTITFHRGDLRGQMQPIDLVDARALEQRPLRSWASRRRATPRRVGR